MHHWGLILGSTLRSLRNVHIFSHGLKGIMVSNEAIIGKQCQLYHQVRIGGGNVDL